MTKPFDIYPRPQLKRESYICLNGEWELAVTKDAQIKITDAQHIVFDGLTFEGFRLTGDKMGLFDLLKCQRWDNTRNTN